MKTKVTYHYLLAFICACSIIFITNITFMRSTIYQKGVLFNYSPSKIMETIESAILLSPTNQPYLTDAGMELLTQKGIGIQILNGSNQEVMSYQKPTSANISYSNVQLIDLYSSKDTTLFVGEKDLGASAYTYLLFFDTEQVNRLIYSYDVNLLMQAHYFPILIILNIILILTLSFLFTLKITKPVKRMIDKIMNLSTGNYATSPVSTGIYFEIEHCLNQLATTLDAVESERKQFDQMQEDWISNITHDIKTPLTSIMGNTEIISDIHYPLEDDMRLKYGNTILSKCEYIKTLVEDLNLSTRLKSNTLILNKHKVNMVSLIRHLLIDIINDEKHNHDNICFEYSHEEIFLEVDEQLMKRVFINLITNTFTHNPTDVQLTISIQQLSSQHIHIMLKDNGDGISENDLKNIFKRFYRGTDTRKKTAGSGLGMAIAHDIIKAHGADIHATSQLAQGLQIDISFSDD